MLFKRRRKTILAGWLFVALPSCQSEPVCSVMDGPYVAHFEVVSQTGTCKDELGDGWMGVANLMPGAGAEALRSRGAMAIALHRTQCEYNAVRSRLGSFAVAEHAAIAVGSFAQRYARQEICPVEASHVTWSHGDVPAWKPGDLSDVRCVAEEWPSCNAAADVPHCDDADALLADVETLRWSEMHVDYRDDNFGGSFDGYLQRARSCGTLNYRFAALFRTPCENDNTCIEAFGRGRQKWWRLACVKDPAGGLSHLTNEVLESCLGQETCICAVRGWE